MKHLSISLSLILLFGGGAQAQDANAVAAAILEKADLDRGLCCVLGAGDGSLPIALVEQSELLVYVREPDAEKVAALQKQADEAGFSIQRLVVEQGPPMLLPFAANTVDLLVTLELDLFETPTGSKSGQYQKTYLQPGAVLYALRPEGMAILSVAKVPEQFVRTWPDILKTGYEPVAVERFELTGKNGPKLAVHLTKPVPEGMDEWSHWEKSPANNPVSEDIHIKAPYMTQFMATPYYIGMPAITTVAGGRTFLAMGHIAHHEREWNMLNRIVARNGYNGIVLWERKLPDDYLVHRSAFVATKDTFHMINGDHVLKLDARTGDEQGKIKIPGFNGDWKWIAVVDGVLYALAGDPGDGVTPIRGKRDMGGWSWGDLSKGLRNGQDGRHIPHGFGDHIAAYDIEKDEALWEHKEESLIDSRGLAILEDDFFLYCPDKHFRCLDRNTGDEKWTTNEELTLEMIEEPGKGLTSTPGWRTQTMVVATPEALVIQGQTRQNVIGMSTRDGSMLWQKKKFTNNPNAIYTGGKVVLGVGENGSHIMIDPKTGTVEDDLKFVKRACTRLTASTDSFFVRGEGMTRYDRATQNVTIDGAVRPACNDGVIPANGLIYLGPWACDCNLSLIGNVARCSAGDWPFDRKSTNKQWDAFFDSPGSRISIEVTEADWPTYRADNARSAGTSVKLAPGSQKKWHYQPKRQVVPCEATAAGGLIFTGGEDGKIRCLDGNTGELVWTFQTGGVVKYPPTISDGYAYVGSGDGRAYCLEAGSGRMEWKFRAAPIQRHIMIYGTLSSTWPVNTGILVHEGVAYFGAGIVDHDGTYVTALDAETGQLKWQNHSSGHLNAEQRKGVSAQGNLTIHDGKLVMAGGNVVSPARYDLETGECLEQARENGQPQSNGGKFVGVFNDTNLLAGGRILYSSPRNVSTKGSFALWSPGPDRQQMTLNYGGVVPAWNDTTLAVAHMKYGKITAFDAEAVSAKVKAGFEEEPNRRNRFSRNIVNALTARNEEKWQSTLGTSGEFEALSLVVAENAVVAVARYNDIRRATPQYNVTAFNPADGKQLFQAQLPSEPLPGGLLIDRNGRIVVSLLDGGMVCYGD